MYAVLMSEMCFHGGKLPVGWRHIDTLQGFCSLGEEQLARDGARCPGTTARLREVGR